MMHPGNHLLQITIAAFPDIEHLLTGVIGQQRGLVLSEASVYSASINR